MASVRFELRVDEAVLSVWRRVAEARAVSLSEFVRAAVERDLGGDGVAAGPPVVEAEREPVEWGVPAEIERLADHVKVAAVNELRGLPGVTTAAELAFAPVAPADAPVQARVVPWKREVRPDPRVKPR